MTEIEEIHFKDAKLFPPNSKKMDLLHKRCLRAEELYWDIDLIPLLSTLCIRTLAENFLENPVLEGLNEKDQKTLFSLIPTTLPLDKQAKLISDQEYWKRCCKDSGRTINVFRYDNDWRRAFFELHAEQCIRKFRPDKDDLGELLEQLEICHPFVQRIIIDQLWQNDPPNPADLYFRHPVPQEGEDQEGRDNPLLPVSECQCVQFTELLSILKNVTEIDITFSVRECADGFAWHLFELREIDCEDLGRALKEKPLLTCFRLRRSRMDGRNAMILLLALQGHPCLRKVDFSHNRIGNLGAKVVSKLLITLPVVEYFDIKNNEIGHEGAEYLAYALSSHPTLKTFNASANKFSDEGGILLCRALAQNSVLENAILSMCDFGEKTFAAIGQMLPLNKSLRLLDIANNNFTDVQAEKLLAGLEQNKTLTKLDIRFSKTGERIEYEIKRLLNRNMHADDDNYVLPRPYSSLMRLLVDESQKRARKENMVDAFSKAQSNADSLSKSHTSEMSVVSSQSSKSAAPLIAIPSSSDSGTTGSVTE